MRQDVSKNLREGNLRGEARWERQVLEALLSNPEVTEVYTSGAVWPIKRHPKYRGLMKSDHSKDTILFTHDWNLDVISKHKYKAILVNIFSGPWESQQEEIHNYVAKYQDNLLFTLSYEIQLTVTV